MKKTLSLILAVMMLLGCMSITAFADKIECQTCHGNGAWEADCPVCRGHALGVCPVCEGLGYLPCPECGKNYYEGCPTCEGNRMTFRCGNNCLDGNVDTCTYEECEWGIVWVQCPDCGGKGYTIDYTHMSDSIEITATISVSDFAYEMVIPSATTLTDEAHENVLLGSDGKVSIANVKHPTDKLNIVYTVDLTNGDLVNGTNTVPTTYGISETADGTFVTIDDTTKVTVYKNKTIINSFVNITADDTAWNNAPGGTYTASVTFNFECEEPVSVKKTIGEILGNDGTEWSNGTISMKATLIGDGYYVVGPDDFLGEHLWAKWEMTQNIDGNFIGDNEDGGTITFIMEDEKCTSFVIAGGYLEDTDFDGTYTRKIKTVADIIAIAPQGSFDAKYWYDDNNQLNSALISDNQLKLSIMSAGLSLEAAVTKQEDGSYQVIESENGNMLTYLLFKMESNKLSSIEYHLLDTAESTDNTCCALTYHETPLN